MVGIIDFNDPDFPKPLPEVETMKDQALERIAEAHARGETAKLIADGEVIGEILAPVEAAVAWIGGTVVVQADDFIRAGALVTSGPTGGVIEWVEGDGGRPLGRAVHAAHRGEGVKVTGFGMDKP